MILIQAVPTDCTEKMPLQSSSSRMGKKEVIKIKQPE
jgi:hypothetical protein